ncbi:VTC domain-containing protein [Pilobolus umbonatus]|nr:VTC domain-containing protein [Pilobolus umbonatus]
MKFSAELNSQTHEPWRESYIQYRKLSSYLRKQKPGWNNQAEMEFTALIENELKKIYAFIESKNEGLIRRIDHADRLLQNYQSQNTTDSASFEKVADKLAEILIDVDDLSKFHEINQLGFQKIIERHDGRTGFDLKTVYLTQLLDTYPMHKLRFDVLIVRISSMYELCKCQGNVDSLNKGECSKGGDQTAFERATKKYWIHPKHIIEVKAIILLHLPVHVFNQQKPYESSDAAVSSVYYDNNNFDLYSERLKRSKGAEAIRFRWYGQSNSENDDIYIERKTHHAPWLENKSVKDRFRLKELKVNDFVSGDHSADDIRAVMEKKEEMDKKAVEENYFVAKGVQDSIRNRHLKPMCRVFYNRTAFQIPGDQRLRISLDSNLTFIREDDMDNDERRMLKNDLLNWRRPDVGVDHRFCHIKEKDILKFPCAILETKIQNHLGQKTPAWLTALLSSHLVHEVPRFSKYIHGVCTLFKDKVPDLPHWLNELEGEIKKPITPNVGLSRSQSFKPLFNGRHRKSLIKGDSEAKIFTPSKPHFYTEDIRVYNGKNNIDNTPTPSLSANRHKLKNSNLRNPSHLTIDVSTTANHLDKAKQGSFLTNSKELRSYLSNSMGFGDNRTVGDRYTPYTLGSGVLEGGQFMKKKKIDPKTFFANERTFIAWLQFCALLLTVSLNLINNGDGISRIIGAVFIIFSSVIALYALGRFQLRVYQIRMGCAALSVEDIYGPIILCILLVAALGVNFYLRAPLLFGVDSVN